MTQNRAVIDVYKRRFDFFAKEEKENGKRKNRNAKYF